MRSPWKRILPILLTAAVLGSMVWYLFSYDTEFTRDMLLRQARLFENSGRHSIAAWLYDRAYRQSANNEEVAIELAQQFKAQGNYTKAEHTLSGAIADGGSAQLYIALCETYVEQDKLLDAVTMLDNISDPQVKSELDALRPAAPTATPAPGFYNKYLTVTIEGAGRLYARSGGEYPSIRTDAYKDGITLTTGENTIYALAIGENGLVSPLTVLGYTVGGVIEEVSFADPAMGALAREMLGKAEDAPVLTSDLWAVTSLTVPRSTLDYSDLQFFPYLTTLIIEGGNPSSLQPVSALSQLTELIITGTIVSSQDLTVIAALPNLSRLTLAGCSLSTIANLEPAKGLKYLDLSNNTVRDISALSAMGTLEALDLSHNALTDLSALSGLQGLQELDVSYNSLAAMEPLASCAGLKTLDISHNAIGKLTGVDALTELSTFAASYNNLTDVDILTANTALITLDISHNSLLDIQALSALTGLKYLTFANNEVEALPQWPKDCALVYIDGSYNKLTSVDTLAGYAHLNEVKMDYNAITSVDALASCHNLIQVDIFGNPVKDVSKLTDSSVIVHYTPNV